MKHKSILFCSLTLLAIAVSGCSSTKVIADKDRTVNFESIKTYEFVGWSKNSDEILNRFDRERIEKAFAEEGSRRGLTKVETDADALVGLFILSKVKTQKTASTTTTGMGGAGMAGGMRHPGWGWGGGMQISQSHTVINERDYIEGTLMIELFDPNDKKLIWQAIGTKTVNENAQKREKGIPKKVAAIMSKYPIKPTK